MHSKKKEQWWEWKVITKEPFDNSKIARWGVRKHRDITKNPLDEYFPIIKGFKQEYLVFVKQNLCLHMDEYLMVSDNHQTETINVWILFIAKGDSF